MLYFVWKYIYIYIYIYGVYIKYKLYYKLEKDFVILLLVVHFWSLKAY